MTPIAAIKPVEVPETTNQPGGIGRAGSNRCCRINAAPRVWGDVRRCDVSETLDTMRPSAARTSAARGGCRASSRLWVVCSGALHAQVGLSGWVAPVADAEDDDSSFFGVLRRSASWMPCSASPADDRSQAHPSVLRDFDDPIEQLPPPDPPQDFRQPLSDRAAPRSVRLQRSQWNLCRRNTRRAAISFPSRTVGDWDFPIGTGTAKDIRPRTIIQASRGPGGIRTTRTC